jgi:hypothetical protein
MAGKLRELARHCRFAGARRELLQLATNYDGRADHIDSRARVSGWPGLKSCDLARPSANQRRWRENLTSVSILKLSVAIRYERDIVKVPQSWCGPRVKGRRPSWFAGPRCLSYSPGPSMGFVDRFGPESGQRQTSDPAKARKIHKPVTESATLPATLFLLSHKNSTSCI